VADLRQFGNLSAVDPPETSRSFQSRSSELKKQTLHQKPGVSEFKHLRSPFLPDKPPFFWRDGATGGTLVFTCGLLDNKTLGFQAYKGAIHANASCSFAFLD
jgi:hypothetical protein